MLLAACEQFLSKTEEQIQQVALETLEGHQRAIMGSMTVEVRVPTLFDVSWNFWRLLENSKTSAAAATELK